jgi:hypothetical protein
VGRDSVVCIETSYGLDVSGIEFRQGQNFPHPSRPVLGPTHPPALSGQEFEISAHSPSSAEVKERVQLYFYSPSGSSWPVIVWTLPNLYLDYSCNSFAATFNIRRLSSSFAPSQSKLRKHTFKSGFACQMAPLNPAVNLTKWLLLKFSAKLLQIIYSIFEIPVSPQRTAPSLPDGFS